EPMIRAERARSAGELVDVLRRRERVARRRVTDDAGELLAAGLIVDRHGDRPDRHDREIRGDPIGTVRRTQQDAVSGRDAERRESRGRSPDTLVQRGITHDLLAVRREDVDCGRLAALRERGGEFRQRLHRIASVPASGTEWTIAGRGPDRPLGCGEAPRPAYLLPFEPEIRWSSSFWAQPAA